MSPWEKRLYRFLATLVASVTVLAATGDLHLALTTCVLVAYLYQPDNF